MNERLQTLIDRIRGIEMTPDQFARQRRSFVYGNTHLENDRITRELVEEIDEAKSEKEKTDSDGK